MTNYEREGVLGGFGLNARVGPGDLYTPGTVAGLTKKKNGLCTIFSPGRVRHGRAKHGWVRVHYALTLCLEFSMIVG